MALYPFILVSDKRFLDDDVLIRHETIHLKQEAELLVIPFYIIYALNYLINYVIYKNHDKAYRAICFEREAYANEQHANYLVKRKLWAWRFYLITKGLHL
ncbi:hypothetical protein SAMN04487890_10776 [Mucilaginibacter polytrichastri]|nr:hypothetical protein SAMN04487890_10776 [Mucilaginibacter polytrichastri]